MDEKMYKDYAEFYDAEIREKIPVRINKFRLMDSDEKVQEFYNDMMMLHKNRLYSERKENSDGLTSIQSHGVYLKRVSKERELLSEVEVNNYLKLLIEKIDKILHDKMGADTVDKDLFFKAIMTHMPSVESVDGQALLLELKEKISLLDKELLSR